MVAPLTEQRSRLHTQASLGISDALVYRKPRYYNPAVARFTELDPFTGDDQSPQSLHKYLYCQGDPVNHIGPSGRDLIGCFGFMGSMLSMEVTVGMMLEQAAFTVLKGAAIAAVLQTAKPAAQMRQDGIDLMTLYGNKYYDVAFQLYSVGSMAVAGACAAASLAYYMVELLEIGWNAISIVKGLTKLVQFPTRRIAMISEVYQVYSLNYVAGATRISFVSFAHTASINWVTLTQAVLETAEAGEIVLNSVQLYFAPNFRDIADEMHESAAVLTELEHFCGEHAEWTVTENDIGYLLERK
jgi:RHS repeat-associated protein